MEQILNNLQELNRLYHSDTLAEYETKWQIVARQIQRDFPGCTIAYAEIYMAESARKTHGGMRHVLLPKLA